MLTVLKVDDNVNIKFDYSKNIIVGKDICNSGCSIAYVLDTDDNSVNLIEIQTLLRYIDKYSLSIEGVEEGKVQGVVMDFTSFYYQNSNITNFEVRQVSKSNFTKYCVINKCRRLGYGIAESKGVLYHTHPVVPVCDFRHMFYNCLWLKSADLSGLVACRVKEFMDWEGLGLNSMFERCVNLRRVNFAGVINRHAKDMYRMFCGCGKLQYVDFSDCDTSCVVDMRQMFQGCRRLECIDLSNFTIVVNTQLDSMFNGCRSLKKVIASKSNYRRLLEELNAVKGCTFDDTGRVIIHLDGIY